MDLSSNWMRQELTVRAATARAYDKQLRALGLEDNECRALADTLEQQLSSLRDA